MNTRKSAVFIFACALTVLLGASSQAAADPERKVYEVDAGAGAAVQALADAGLDIWGVEGTIVTVALTEAEVAEVQAMGLYPRVVISDFDALAQATDSVSAMSTVQYHTYDSLLTDLYALESTGLVRAYVVGTSLEGRDIVAVKVSDNPSVDDPSEPDSLFLGCHHAREWISVEVPYYLAKHLVDNYSTDPQIRSFVDNGEIWIVPMVNPDGFEYSRTTNRMWRKNRRDNGGGIYGVDPNRNFGSGWGGPGSSGSPSSDTYRGTGPFSEPETATVRDLVLDRSFQAMITFHSYSQLVMWPLGYTNEKAPDDAHLARLGNEMAYRIKQVNGKFYTPQKSSALYLASGTTDDWFYENQGLPGFTIELRPTGPAPGFLLPATEILPTSEENIPAALYLVGLTQSDADGDGVPAIMDNCPSVVNPGQEDADGDGIGDACETAADRDGDGVADGSDNCPDKANADQKDADNDGFGDLCDPTSAGGTCASVGGGDGGSDGPWTIVLVLGAGAAFLEKRRRRR